MKAKKIISVLFKTIFIALFVFSLFCIASAVFLKISGKNKPAAIFGLSFFEVLTDSMQPEINVGEIVIVKKTAPEKLKAGDVITFRYNGITNTHKIVSIQDGKITTRGVNAPADDEPIAFEAVIGKVIAHSAAFGWVFSFLKSPYGLVFLLIIPALILLAYETYNVKEKLKSCRAAKAAARKSEIDKLKAERDALSGQIEKDN